MKIYYSKALCHLPDIIETCTSPVYAVFENDSRVVINANPEILSLFRGTCESVKGNMELDLQFTNPNDISNVLNFLVNGGRTKALKSA